MLFRSGIWAATLTPFLPDGAIDEAGFWSNIRHWIGELGIDGLFIAGKQGEFFSLSIPERKRVFEITMEETQGKAGAILSCSDQNMDVVLDLARHAEKVGADATICLAPYYWPVPEEALHDHFYRVAKASSLPFMIYNSPIFHGTSLSPKFLVRLIEELPNFIGEKEASHNFEYFIEARRLTQKVRPEFGLILGVEYIIPSMSMGGVGSMSIAGSVAPNIMQKLYDLCAAGKYGEALPLQDKASHYWQIFKPEYPSPIKAAMEMMGRPVGVVRGPMRPLTDAQKKTLRKELEVLGAFDGSEPMGW